MKNKLILTFLILMSFVVFMPLTHAQPKIPKETIPADINPELKKQMERLYSDDPVERGYGAYYLGEMSEKATAAVPFLIATLHDTSPLKARHVLIVKYPWGEYIYENPWWKKWNTSPGQEAAEALAKIGKSSVTLLISALKDNDSSVRMHAAFALGEIRDVGAVEPLNKAIKDKDHDVRMRVVNALGKILDSRSVEPLMEALKDKYPGVRIEAAFLIGFLKDKRTVEPLISALNDEVSLVRRYAAMSLIQVGDERASNALHAALKDEDPEVRQCAATALGKIKDTKAVDELITVLNEKGGQKNRASWSNPSGSDTNTRSSAALALGDIGGARAIEALINVLRDDDLTVSMNAIISLQKITKQNFGPVAPLEEDHIKKWEEWWKENKGKYR
jgi:HEAT repeat protein